MQMSVFAIAAVEYTQMPQFHYCNGYEKISATVGKYWYA